MPALQLVRGDRLLVPIVKFVRLGLVTCGFAGDAVGVNQGADQQLPEPQLVQCLFHFDGNRIWTRAASVARLRLCQVIRQGSYEHVYAIEFLPAVDPIQHDDSPFRLDSQYVSARSMPRLMR